jgi:hypothetical protein
MRGVTAVRAHEAPPQVRRALSRWQHRRRRERLRELLGTAAVCLVWLCLGALYALRVGWLG